MKALPKARVLQATAHCLETAPLFVKHVSSPGPSYRKLSRAGCDSLATRWWANGSANVLKLLRALMYIAIDILAAYSATLQRHKMRRYRRNEERSCSSMAADEGRQEQYCSWEHEGREGLSCDIRRTGASGAFIPRHGLLLYNLR